MIMQWQVALTRRLIDSGFDDLSAADWFLRHGKALRALYNSLDLDEDDKTKLLTSLVENIIFCASRSEQVQQMDG